jgi:hypothetical protein
MNILHSPDSMGFERVQKNLQKNRMTGWKITAGVLTRSSKLVAFQAFSSTICA